MGAEERNPEEGDETGAGRGEAAVSGSPGNLQVDLDFVRGLIEAVDGSGIDSLEITRAGTRVKISKTPPFAPPQPLMHGMYAPPSALPASQPQAAPPPSGGGAEGQSSAAPPTPTPSETASSNGLVEVKSPMVGTFYRSPAPEAPSYVEVGTRVSKGQTLCILEAMKLMNELEAEIEGVVREVLVDNAEPVEYGQVLFRIDPNG